MGLNRIYNDYASNCVDIKQKISKYARFSSYGSILMTERLFEIFFMRFEALIEETFIAYAMGNLSIKGTDPGRKILLTDRMEIIGLVSGQKDYPDWTRWDYIIDIANLFFGISPYNELKNHLSNLNDLKTIRNALAHISGSSQDKFASLVRRKLTYYPPAFTVKDFLYYRVGDIKSQIYFQEYVDSSLAAAKVICE